MGWKVVFYVVSFMKKKRQNEPNPSTIHLSKHAKIIKLNMIRLS